MRWVAVAVLVALGIACRPPGMGHVETQDIGKVRDLETLMWVQADTADPQFDMVEGLDDPAEMTEAQLLALRHMGERLQLTARRALSFSKGPGFDELARTLEIKASALANLARDGDRAAAASATLSIRETCRTCHEQYR